MLTKHNSYGAKRCLTLCFFLSPKLELFWRAKKTLSHLVFASYRTLFGMRHWLLGENYKNKISMVPTEVRTSPTGLGAPHSLWTPNY